MKLEKIECDFSICQISNVEQADLSQKYVFVSKTTDEISLVCETCYVTADIVSCEHGWKALKISGVLDFTMTGVIAKISDLLAKSDICIFVISTYNTDYIFMKADNYDNGIRALEQSGYIVV